MFEYTRIGFRNNQIESSLAFHAWLLNLTPKSMISRVVQRTEQMLLHWSNSMMTLNSLTSWRTSACLLQVKMKPSVIAATQDYSKTFNFWKIGSKSTKWRKRPKPIKVSTQTAFKQIGQEILSTHQVLRTKYWDSRKHLNLQIRKVLAKITNLRLQRSTINLLSTSLVHSQTDPTLAHRTSFSLCLKSRESK